MHKIASTWQVPGLVMAATMHLFSGVGTYAQQPQQPPEARIVVTGEASVNVTPNYAQIRSGVTVRTKTVKEGVDANSRLWWPSSPRSKMRPRSRTRDAKAEVYAKAAGVQLGRVEWITEETGSGPPVPMMTRAQAAPVPITAVEDMLQVKVTVGFEIAR